MARGAMPWTIAMEQALSDGEWHDLNDVIKVGAAEIPRERALAEMGEGRAANSDEDRRAAAGASTLARQALMGMRRFGRAEVSSDKKQIRRASDASVNPGVLAERVSVLEAQVARLFEQQVMVFNQLTLLAGGTLPNVDVEETLRSLDGLRQERPVGTVTGRFESDAGAVDEVDDRVRDAAPGTVRVGDAEVDLS